MQKENYIQCGLISYFSPDFKTTEDVPLYIKAGEVNKGGLAVNEKVQLKKVSDIFIRQHEKELLATIRNRIGK